MKTNYTAEQLLERRLSGILPEISIGKDLYLIDWNLRELRMKEMPEKRIDIRHLPLTTDGKSYQFFYNTANSEQVRLSDHLKKLPKNVVLVEIPNETVLDPIATAREFRKADTALLARFPIMANLEAKLTPLEQTAIGALIQQNNRQRPGLIRKWIFKKRKGL